jgi:hypothetical protein
MAYIRISMPAFNLYKLIPYWIVRLAISIGYVIILLFNLTDIYFIIYL